MHGLLSTTVALVALTTGIDASKYGALNDAVHTWHANTDAHHNGGNANEICSCIQKLASVDSCTLVYAFPDGKSAWGTLLYSASSKTPLPQGKVCAVSGGGGYVLSGG